MSLIEDMRLQDAVYWEALGQDESGDYRFALPENMKVRWQDRKTVLTRDDAQDVVYNGKIFVDRPIPVGSRLLKGKTVADLAAPLPPPNEAKEVLYFDELPDIDCEETLYTVMI